VRIARARASTARLSVSHIDANNYVAYDTPVPIDPTSWAQGRITGGLQEFGSSLAATLQTPA
jgi:hypothetical protein